MTYEELCNTCKEMIDAFCERYDKLLKVKTVLVTGGTGTAYYPIIKELLKEKAWINVVLTDYEFYGSKISPEFAIAVGMYKAVYNKYSRTA